MINTNINIKPADEYNKAEQARLKLNISEKDYKKLKDDFGISKREEENRKKAAREKSSTKFEFDMTPEPGLKNPLEFNLDMPFTT